MLHVYDIVKNLVTNKVIVFLNGLGALLKSEVPKDEDFGLIP